MGESTKIVIADDHPVFRAGIRQILEKETTLEVVGEAENGEEALKLIMDLRPRIAILDFQMPKMTGLDVVRRLEAVGSETKIIFLTMIDDKRIFLEAMDLGVAGYVLKDSAVSEILHAVRAVLNDRPFVSPALTAFLLQRRSEVPQKPEALKGLTPAELHILKLIGDLKSNQEIADEVFISKRTVENHRVNIARKLNLKGSHVLLKVALENKEIL
ncbi:MAG: response regulator transcription factor [Bacteroidota bacterium]